MNDQHPEPSHFHSRPLFISPLICLAAFVVTEMLLSIHLVMFDTSFEVNGGILQPNADSIADLAAAAASWPSCEQATVLVLLIRQPQRPAKTQRLEHSWNFGTDLTQIGSEQHHQNLYSPLMTVGFWHPLQHDWLVSFPLMTSLARSINLKVWALTLLNLEYFPPGIQFILVLYCISSYFFSVFVKLWFKNRQRPNQLNIRAQVRIICNMQWI